MRDKSLKDENDKVNLGNTLIFRRLSVKILTVVTILLIINCCALLCFSNQILQQKCTGFEIRLR